MTNVAISQEHLDQLLKIQHDYFALLALANKDGGAPVREVLRHVPGFAVHEGIVPDAVVGVPNIERTPSNLVPPHQPKTPLEFEVKDGALVFTDPPILGLGDELELTSVETVGPEGMIRSVQSAYLRKAVTWDGTTVVSTPMPTPDDEVESLTIPVPAGATVTHTEVVDAARDDLGLPEGWPAPASDITVLEQQYADAAQDVVRTATLHESMVANWRSIMVIPNATEALLMALVLVFERAAGDLATWDPECMECRPILSRETAQMLQAMRSADLAVQTCLVDFFEYLVAHHEASFAWHTHISNMRAVGMSALADYFAKIV